MTYIWVLAAGSVLTLATAATMASAENGCLSTVDAINAQIEWEKEAPELKSAQIVACARAQANNPGSYGNSAEENEACAFRGKPKCEPSPNAARALEFGNALPQYKRDAMVRKYQTIFAPQLHLDRFQIITASYLPQGSEYIVCGTGRMSKGGWSGPSQYIFDSRNGKVRNVEPEEFQRRCITSARVDLTQ